MLEKYDLFYYNYFRIEVSDMKKGFTLVELLVVIAIIGILSVIVVPSITSINRSINERLLASKKEEISSNAELYAGNNEEIFNGTNEAYIYVWELVDANYVSVDAKVGDDQCTGSDVKTTKGCVINPVDKSSMNKDYVILTKQGAGVSSKYISMGDGTGSNGLQGNTLVKAVCDLFNKSNGNAYVNGDIVPCKCSDDKDSVYTDNPAKLVTTSGEEVNACILSGTDVNNHLRYGNINSNHPNWRVLGLYKIDGHVTAKMITSGAV